MFKNSKSCENKHSLKTTVANVLSLTVLLCIVGSIFLAIQGKATPDLVTNIGTSVSGALIAILIPPRG